MKRTFGLFGIIMIMIFVWQILFVQPSLEDFHNTTDVSDVIQTQKEDIYFIVYYYDSGHPHAHQAFEHALTFQEYSSPEIPFLTIDIRNVVGMTQEEKNEIIVKIEVYNGEEMTEVHNGIISVNRFFENNNK